ncbi:MAG: hypothetical protein SA339_08305 [Methanomassiliicoccus sp.]|nr:hypothetical protein [Methanomassiliicoccus sp.]
MDLLFGLTAGAMLFLGVVVFLIGWIGFGIPKKYGSWIKVIGGIMVLIGAGAYVGLIGTSGTPQATIETATYDIGYTESQAWQTYDSETHVITVAMNYNLTNKAFVGGTGSITGVFALTRSDALTTDASALGTLGNVAMVDVTGASPEPILAQNSDNSYQFVWTKASGATVHPDVSVLVPAGDSVNVTLTVTFNADAVDAMAHYETQDVTFTLAGEQFTIHAILATVA